MAVGKPNPRTPYAVCVRYRWRDEPTATYTLTHRKRLSAALETVRATTTAWLRLVGAQPTPLEWLVIDERDLAEFRPGIASKFGETDGKDEAGRPYARRGGSAGLG